MPLQSNNFDCGFYLLHFARHFLLDPRASTEVRYLILSPQLVMSALMQASIENKFTLDNSLSPKEIEQHRKIFEEKIRRLACEFSG